MQAYFRDHPEVRLPFACCCLAMITAGTHYAFPLFGPDIAIALEFSSIQTSMIANLGDWGLAISGPMWGILLERCGAKRACLIASAFTFTGYALMALAVEGSWEFIPRSWPMLAVYFGIVGVGSQATYLACISVLAQNFPTSLRGTALGIPIAVFGLSALFFSALDRTFFVGMPGSSGVIGLLWLFSLICGAGNLIASFGLPSSPPPRPSTSPLHEDTDALLSPGHGRKRKDSSLPSSDLAHPPRPFHRDVDAWLIALLLFTTTGTGITYINNVGAMAHAWNPASPTDAQDATTTHVATFSFASASARGLIGWASDRGAGSSAGPIARLPWVAAATAGIALGQLGAWASPGNSLLTAITLLTGFAYGAMFTLCPTLVSEWWGELRFARHWGWMALAPGLGGALFNYLFGTILDTHRTTPEGEACVGRSCYADAFIFTGFACTACLFIVHALYRRLSQASVWSSLDATGLLSPHLEDDDEADATGAHTPIRSRQRDAHVNVDVLELDQVAGFVSSSKDH